jgi:hypothetical protein
LPEDNQSIILARFFVPSTGNQASLELQFYKKYQSYKGQRVFGGELELSAQTLPDEGKMTGPENLVPKRFKLS